jgi:hypothetical protein
VNKSLGKLALFAESGSVLGILRVRLHELLDRGTRHIVQRDAIENMEINSISESTLEFVIVRFPDYDLKVSTIKVGIADGVARVRDEELSDVWQGLVGEEVHLAASTAALMPLK